MEIDNDTLPVAAFRDDTAEVMAHLRTTGRPVTLTVDGKPAAVVQDAEAYQRLLDLAADADASEGVRQGLEDLRSGRVRPACDVFDELRAENGLPR